MCVCGSVAVCRPRGAEKPANPMSLLRNRCALQKQSIKLNDWVTARDARWMR